MPHSPAPSTADPGGRFPDPAVLSGQPHGGPLDGVAVFARSPAYRPSCALCLACSRCFTDRAATCDLCAACSRCKGAREAAGQCVSGPVSQAGNQ